eukprot:TRINITY_DN2423_c0_g2_i11.p1 TRINITY_DN2423_c0_g2~~TRINITY_DN2423_c0_g2_i11.p1  ORF type:complete len:128 (-),score=11.13 TRINITY_DN2423_c0_g2_i11:414-797(-)
MHDVSWIQTRDCRSRVEPCIDCKDVCMHQSLYKLQRALRFAVADAELSVGVEATAIDSAVGVKDERVLKACTRAGDCDICRCVHADGISDALVSSIAKLSACIVSPCVCSSIVYQAGILDLMVRRMG